MFRILFFFFMIFLAAPPAGAESPAASGASSPKTAPECSCTAENFDQYWRKSAAVFIGTVTGVQIIDKLDNPYIEDKPVKVIVSVEKIYKGIEEKEKSFIFFSNLARTTCMGYNYEKGVKYLFFAYERIPYETREWSLYRYPSETYDVGGVCGGTRKFDDAADILKQAEAYAAEEKKNGGFFQKLLK